MADDLNPTRTPHVDDPRITCNPGPEPLGVNGRTVSVPEARPTAGRGFLRRIWGGSASPTSRTPSPQPADSVREIVETVVFVVILVLLLKSFTAEAFVIPTGSMAETLYGYQKIVRCPQCGYQFPVNCSSEVDPQDGHPTPVRGCTCPNCRVHVDLREERSWSSGDRVLVAKFLYDLFKRQPDRLDVVVFKYPGDGSQRLGSAWPRTGPFKGHVPMNYIKRLIGLPGETIVIHDGNLYVLPASAGTDFPDDAREAAAEGRPPQLWLTKYMHARTGVQAADFFKEQRDRLQIIRKTPEKMLSERRIVYDNDYPAKDLDGPTRARWLDNDSHWVEQPADHSFRLSSTGGATSWLHYRHVLRGDKRPQLVTDFMGYNTYENNLHSGPPGENWVGDLMVDCEVAVEKPGGSLELELSRGADRFQARFTLDGSGTCRLFRVAGGKEELLESKETPLKKPGTYRLRFANFDERLTVWVGSALPFGDGVVYPPSNQSGPVAANDLHPVGVGGRDTEVSVRKLQVWRDTYYTVARDDAANEPDAGRGIDFADPKRWEGLGDLPYKTLYVQPGHYLCLGDNSPESSDGRAWGLVPERLMLGRALFVYWPVHPVNRTGRIR